MNKRNCRVWPQNDRTMDKYTKPMCCCVCTIFMCNDIAYSSNPSLSMYTNDTHMLHLVIVNRHQSSECDFECMIYFTLYFTTYTFRFMLLHILVMTQCFPLWPWYFVTVSTDVHCPSWVSNNVSHIHMWDEICVLSHKRKPFIKEHTVGNDKDRKRRIKNKHIYKVQFNREGEKSSQTEDEH